MRLTLRKALKLRKQLEIDLAKVDLPLTVELSVLVAANRETPLSAVGKAADALEARKAQRVALSRILRDLRIAISRENVESGVDAFLAAGADLDRRIALEKAVADAKETPEEEELQGEFRIVNAGLLPGERARAYEEPARKVTVAVVSAEMRSAARNALSELRREREAVEDSRIAANSGRGIEIADGDAELLRESGFV